jgi:hypothetical protein
MFDFEELLQSSEYQSAKPEARQKVEDLYARDFWTELTSNPDFSALSPEEQAEYRDGFLKRFKNAPYILAELEGQEGPLSRGFERAGSAMKYGAKMAVNDTAGAAETLAEAEEYRLRNPGTMAGKGLREAWDRGEGITGGTKEVIGEIKKDWQEADTLGEKFKATGENLSAMGGAVLEQTPNMMAPMAGTLTGGALGSTASPVIGTGVGMFAGGTTGYMFVEGQEQAMKALGAAGIDPRDREAVEAFLLQNKDKLFTQTLKKSAVLGFVDAISLGVASKLLQGPIRAATQRAFTSLGVDVTNQAAVKAAIQTPEFAAKIAGDATYQASKQGVALLARNTAAASMEPIGEFAGEYGGQGWATGEWNEKDAFLEAAMSLGTSAATFAGQKVWQAAITPGEAVDPPPVESILEATDVDDAIERFTKTVDATIGSIDSKITGDIKLPESIPVDQIVTPYSMEDSARDIEKIDNQQTFEANRISTPQESASVLEGMPETDLERQLAKREEYQGVAEDIERQANLQSLEGNRRSTTAETYEVLANTPEPALEQEASGQEKPNRKEDVEQAIKADNQQQLELNRRSTKAETYEALANAPMPDEAPAMPPKASRKADVEAALTEGSKLGLEERRRSTKAETYETLSNAPENETERFLSRKEAVGSEYSKSTDHLDKQTGIEQTFESKKPDFTASKGKPFASEASLRMSARQKDVDLTSFDIVPVDGGYIGIHRPETEHARKEIIDTPESVALGQTIAPSPSEAQKEAGNYQKAHVQVDGLDVSIENPAGYERTGTDEDGTKWSVTLKNDYGYIRGTKGYDKDHVDVFIAPKYEGGSGKVFVVNQYDEAGKFDEHKAVLGATSSDEAMDIYNSNYEKGWDRGKDVVEMTTEQFKEWSTSDAPKRGPARNADQQIEQGSVAVGDTVYYEDVRDPEKRLPGNFRGFDGQGNAVIVPEKGIQMSLPASKIYYGKKSSTTDAAPGYAEFMKQLNDALYETTKAIAAAQTTDATDYRKMFERLDIERAEKLLDGAKKHEEFHPDSIAMYDRILAKRKEGVSRQENQGKAEPVETGVPEYTDEELSGTTVQHKVLLPNNKVHAVPMDAKSALAEIDEEISLYEKILKCVES